MCCACVRELENKSKSYFIILLLAFSKMTHESQQCDDTWLLYSIS